MAADMTETHSPQTLGPAQRTGRLVRALAIGAVLIAAWTSLRSCAQLTGAERDVWWQGWLYAGSVLTLGGGVALLGALAVLRGRGREAGWLLLLSGCAHTVTALVGIPQYVVRNHVSNLLAKLGVADRTAAALRAREAGFGGE